MTTNRGWVIDHASKGHYSADCLRWAELDTPQAGPGQVLVRTQLLSIDPTTRNWLLLEPEKQFIPVGVGDVMIGSAVGTVVASGDERFAAGDLVSGLWGWAEYSLAEPGLLERHDRADGIPDEAYLSVFSHIGRAAAGGLIEIGKIREGETVVVSGAAGATGSLAVQIAKARGCRVIGIAGGADKCAYAATLGADATIDYKTADVLSELGRLCPGGVDVFFDNIGGPVLDAVLLTMAVGCRIVICGAMSQYDLLDPADQYGVQNLQMLLFRSARIEGFVVPQFFARYAQLDAVLRELWDSGRLKHRAHVIPGLDAAPEAVNLNLQGRNEGKLMVRVAQG